MDFAARNIVINCIGGYQKFISPYKGFCCAHRVLHEGASCSEWAKHAVKKVGIYGAFPLIIRRIKACNAAYQEIKQLNSNAEEGNEKEKKDYNPFTDKENIGCCISACPCVPISS